MQKSEPTKNRTESHQMMYYTNILSLQQKSENTLLTIVNNLRLEPKDKIIILERKDRIYRLSLIILLSWRNNTALFLSVCLCLLSNEKKSNIPTYVDSTWHLHSMYLSFHLISIHEFRSTSIFHTLWHRDRLMYNILIKNQNRPSLGDYINESSRAPNSRLTSFHSLV